MILAIIPQLKQWVFSLVQSIIEQFSISVSFLELSPTYTVLFKVKNIRKPVPVIFTSIENVKNELYVKVLNQLLVKKHEFTQLPIHVQKELMVFCELPTDNTNKYSLTLNHIEIAKSSISTRVTINIDGYILSTSNSNTTHKQEFNFILCEKNTELPYMELFLMLDYLERNNITNETKNSRELTKPMPSKITYYIEKFNLPISLLTYIQDIPNQKETINFRLDNSNNIGTLLIYNKNTDFFMYDFILSTEWKKKMELTACTYAISEKERIEKSIGNLLKELYAIIQILP